MPAVTHALFVLAFKRHCIQHRDGHQRGSDFATVAGFPLPLVRHVVRSVRLPSTACLPTCLRACLSDVCVRPPTDAPFTICPHTPTHRAYFAARLDAARSSHSLNSPASISSSEMESNYDASVVIAEEEVEDEEKEEDEGDDRSSFGGGRRDDEDGDDDGHGADGGGGAGAASSIGAGPSEARGADAGSNGRGGSVGGSSHSRSSLGGSRCVT